MKTKLIFPLLWAALLPGLALASTVTDQADQTFSQPLEPKTTAVQASVVQADNIYGQSDAMTQVLAKSANNTERSTTFGGDTMPVFTNEKPLDW